MQDAEKPRETSKDVEPPNLVMTFKFIATMKSVSQETARSSTPIWRGKFTTSEIAKVQAFA